MTLLLLSFFIMLLAFTGLAAGILLGRHPIRGSCGGLSQWGWQCVCAEPCAQKRQYLNTDQEVKSNQKSASHRSNHSEDITC